jgi:hypothetical protein
MPTLILAALLCARSHRHDPDVESGGPGIRKSPRSRRWRGNRSRRIVAIHHRQGPVPLDPAGRATSVSSRPPRPRPRTHDGVGDIMADARTARASASCAACHVTPRGAAGRGRCTRGRTAATHPISSGSAFRDEITADLRQIRGTAIAQPRPRSPADPLLWAGISRQITALANGIVMTGGDPAPTRPSREAVLRRGSTPRSASSWAPSERDGTRGLGLRSPRHQPAER